MRSTAGLLLCIISMISSKLSSIRAIRTFSWPWRAHTYVKIRCYISKYSRWPEKNAKIWLFFKVHHLLPLHVFHTLSHLKIISSKSHQICSAGIIDHGFLTKSFFFLNSLPCPTLRFPPHSLRLPENDTYNRETFNGWEFGWNSMYSASSLLVCPSPLLLQLSPCFRASRMCAFH